MLHDSTSHSYVRASTLHFILIWVVCLFGVAAHAGADKYPDPATADMLISIQADLFNGHFQRAYQVIDSFRTDHPKDPIGCLYKAGAYMAEMTDAEGNLYPAQLHTMADSAIDLAEAELAKASPQHRAWMYLIIGHARAYESLWESRFGSFTTALRLGLKAKSAYMDGLEADSTVYDLYGGLGMYHYWKSAKAGILRMIRIFSNDKEKGIGELYLAIDSSRISAAAARNALIYIYLDQKKYDSAIAMAKEMLQTYPEGRQFLWPLAQAYFESEKYAEAAEVYGKLRASLAEDPGNYFNIIECDYDLYQCYDKLNDRASCERVAAGLPGYYDRIPDETLKRQRSKIGYLNRRAKDYPRQAGY